MVSQQQLSLFDTATVVKPPYKVGDLVKIRKRPIAASYVKKGDVVEIVAVHPLNGSIKFWNERSERGEFLYPDEIGSIVPPADNYDSVSTDKAQIVITESNYPHSETDSNPALDAVTESKVPPGNDDSVTPVEPVVTESTPPAEFDDSLALKAISTYKPRGTARSGEYFRLSYRDGSRVKHVHIRGGNTGSPIAQAKAAEVRSLLVAGVLSPQEIATMLRTNQSKSVTK